MQASQLASFCMEHNLHGNCISKVPGTSHFSILRFGYPQNVKCPFPIQSLVDFLFALIKETKLTDYEKALVRVYVTVS
jgi:hypothetical protein